MKMSPELKEIYDYANAVMVKPEQQDVRTLAFCVMALVRAIAEKESEGDDVSLVGWESEKNFDQGAAIDGVRFRTTKSVLEKLGMLRKPSL